MSRITLLAALLGLVLGLGIAFVLERLDRRIKKPEELEAILGAPLLGVVPKTRNLAHFRRDKQGANSPLPPTELECFRRIRAHMSLFDVHGKLRILLITSAERGDGKTTIAGNVARTAARSGARVLLVEADLREPSLATRLGLPAGPGLTDLLTGQASPEEATQSIDADPEHTSPAAQRLEVITAGSGVASNPGELLERRALESLLVRARSTYQLIVLDTPPLTSVSDAFPLLSAVDGVVIVGRLGHSRREATEQLRKIFGNSDASLLGVVANAAKTAAWQGRAYAAGADIAAPPQSSNGALKPEDLVSGAKV